VELVIAPDGGVTGTTREDGRVKWLASRHAPIAEGERLAESVDPKASAAVVVMGIGVGHHVAALLRRVGRQGVVIAFEPDVSLLRAVLERADLSAWLASGNLVVLTDAGDAGAISAGTQGIEAILASGTVLLDHPASRGRLGAERDRFAAAFAHVMKAVRTNVVTTLVQMDITVRNLLQNLRWYGAAPGVKELAGAAKGLPAVVVSAGPSLRRNLHLLAQPGVRDRVVIIAVQTVLKQMLDAGIKPHFVTALDYHEISRRFYEGLTPEAVEGVTLVVEAKANPAILEAYPGAIRCVGDDTLDAVLGPGLARDLGRLPPGATVAHLAYSLARHLGCDPVLLIGQDLGFTDGQYYGPGAAIHRVWAGELNEFNTLEMLEWQRIARMRSMLRSTTDVMGRPIYTDEQMSTYLVQFEREFLRDAEAGLTTIDATEGGVRKRHTTPMPLSEALARWAGGEPDARPSALASGVRSQLSGSRLAEIEARLKSLRHSAWRVGELSSRADGVLGEMELALGDHAAVNALIGRVNEIGREAAGNSAYWLVQHVNQAGQLNRFKADRAIEVEGLTGVERQRREIERDRRNVQWLGEASNVVGEMLDDALSALRGGRVQTREQTPMVRNAGGRCNAWACVLVDAEVGGLGIGRDLSASFAHGMNPLRLLLARLARCTRLAGVVLLCRDERGTRAVVGDAPAGVRVEYEPWRACQRERRAKAVGRAWSRHCWRGGLGNLTCFDEALDAHALAPVMRARSIDAALVIGADWALVDPVLVDALIERHEERPAAHAMTFTQAVPGLAPCLLAASLVEEMARVGGVGASVGTLVGYSPVAPQSDPIAKGVCVEVPPGVRDAFVRCVPDTPVHAARLSRALSVLGAGIIDADAARIASTLRDAGLHREGPPEAVTLRVRHGMDRGAAWTWLHEVIRAGDAPAVTFVGDRCDVLDVPGAGELVAMARALGASAVHVRTGLISPGGEKTRAAATADVLSVDLIAHDAETYRALAGVDRFDATRERVVQLIKAGVATETSGGAWPDRWVVPRITRRDEVYDQIESFYATWLVRCGACTIDAMEVGVAGARIEPLPLPTSVRERLAWSRVAIDADGAVRNGVGDVVGDLRSAPLAAREVTV